MKNKQKELLNHQLAVNRLEKILLKACLDNKKIIAKKLGSFMVLEDKDNNFLGAFYKYFLFETVNNFELKYKISPKIKYKFKKFKQVKYHPEIEYLERFIGKNT